ncbi:DNA polymerase III subunit delta' [Pseudoxanthomonas daejeonensis]|uniref:DNA polymerase III subunit delta' n=1 Tax=Pseudoxanthomonas daejeonensis TaxID=266062 RepID=UPI001F543232|nr:DNA polymerase III subunit delta' [Pseudoxanthomonas daejeonensis]UNK57719.1 DNA polymerase III subunit delta' [Pseudoxanthomonas daejeonensis]
MSEALAPWQQRVHDQALATLAAGRLGHALLLCGPSGLGKRAVADRMAAYVLSAGDPVAEARNRPLIAAGTHPDLHVVSFMPNREGTRLRTEIVIEQIRELGRQLSLTPQYGRAQVAIIDPADALNGSAGNALLKTLEEPVPGRYLWLVSARPGRLPATIRSRCQRLEFRLPPREEGLAWLQGRGHAAAAASDALQAAQDHPGLADVWLRGDGLALRREVAADLGALETGRADPLEAALRWSADERAVERLAHAAEHVRDQAGRAGLTDPDRLHKLAAWFDAANRARELLRSTVRADLVMTDLLLAWRDASRQQAGKGDNR